MKWTACRGARTLLDWLASDFVDHGYDIKHLISDDPDFARVLDARGAREPAEPPARGYVFAGPEVRRLTAEQFADAIGAMTGEWNTYTRARRRPRRQRTASPPPEPPPSMPPPSGAYAPRVARRRRPA